VNQQRFALNARRLWVLAGVALAYLGWLYHWHALSGFRLLDGSIGVLLGLYICSHPAANAVDVLFFERGALQRLSTDWAGLRWLALNLLVLLLGWVVIALGATRFAAPAA
jgi:hypothetical protein